MTATNIVLDGIFLGSPGDFPVKPISPGMFDSLTHPGGSEFANEQFASGQAGDSGGGEESSITERH
jgi:hypothetical protein